MSITALEMIGRAMTKSGFTRPSQNQISTLNSPGNKAYYALLEAISVLTQLTPDWGWNAVETTTTTTASDSTPTTASNVKENQMFGF